MRAGTEAQDADASPPGVDVGALLRAVALWGGGDGAGARRLCVEIASAAQRGGSEEEVAIARAASVGWTLATGRWAQALRATESLLGNTRTPRLTLLLELVRAALWRAAGRRERALGALETLADPDPADTLLVALLTLERATLRAEIGDRDAGLAGLAAATAAFRALRLARFEAVSLRRASAVELARGVHTRAIESLRECVSLADATLDAEAGAAAHADLAVALLLAEAPAEAALAARAACAAWLALPRTSEPSGTTPWLRALWVLAEAGEAGEAIASLGAHPRAPSLLALRDHTAWLLEAEIARRAGDAERFARCARAAWECASQSALRAADPVLGARISAAPAAEALRAGVAVDHTFTRLVEIAPDALDALLVELLEDRSAERRLRALAWIGRRGGSSFEPAVRRATRDANARVAAAATALLPRLCAATSPSLRVRSFGALAVTRGGESIPERAWRGAVTRRLFCRLLVAEGRAVAREAICDDLWPDADPSAARGHLRVALSRLRQALDPSSPPDGPEQLVRTSGDALQLDPARIEWWDLRAFEDAAREGLRAARGRQDQAIGSLREALALYGEALLPECRYEPWALALRARSAARFREVGARLGALLLSSGDLDGAAVVSARLLREDPADEDAAALRMRILLERGEAAQALRVFEETRAALARILAVEPGETLRALAAASRR